MCYHAKQTKTKCILQWNETKVAKHENQKGKLQNKESRKTTKIAEQKIAERRQNNV